MLQSSDSILARSESIMRTFILVVGLAALLLWTDSARAQPAAPRFPAAGDEESWQQIRGTSPALPAWARALAEPLPRTTGAMLYLDYVHRTKNPLGPILAGKLHWIAADAIGCEYARRSAEADLRRSGLKDEDLQQLAGDPKKLPYPDRIAMEFARKLTLAAYKVTDAEVAALIKEFEPEKVVAMVHTLAWANFQNRIVLALGVQVERDGPLPPLDPHLDPDRQIKAPPRPAWKEAQSASTTATIGRPDWRKLTEVELESALADQKARQPRIPLPKETKTPATKIVWTHVSSNYQPLLTQTWFDTMRTFQQEAKLDRVFSNSYFWVITRTNECFY
jgi:alkylhydroperoxidase family enzyme